MHEFINYKTGEKLRCDFRTVSADSPELLRSLQICVRDEYGETYPREDIYNLTRLADQIRTGRLTVLLAIAEDGDPVSSLALSPCGWLTDVPEMTMHVVRKKYRGYGIGTVLTKALLRLPEARNHCAVTAHSVTFHSMAQHQTLDCGLIPCGFLLNVHSNEVLRHSFDTKGCLKQSFAVSVFPENKCDVGALYVPDAHKDFVLAIYRRLGIRSALKLGKKNTGSAQIALHRDETHHTVTAEIFKGGSDIGQWAQSLIEDNRHPLQTVNVFLNLNDPGAPDTYEKLHSRGFVFTGLHPLCGNGEFMLLHHPMAMGLPLQKLCVDDGYSEVYKYICDCAEEVYEIDKSEDQSSAVAGIAARACADVCGHGG